MGGALCKCWAWWQYSDREGSEPCSPSSSFLSYDELEEFNPAAAETNETSSSSSSSSYTPTNYDVFLSFSGQDTRLTFTSHLYRALNQAGFQTFMDMEELKEGEEIAPNLLKAIAESRISIPIFSINYASSKWCLKELVKIMESRDTNGHSVFPIFLNVDPRHVRNQSEGFGRAFDQLAKNSDLENVESWKKALKQAGKLKGWDLKNIDNGNESTLIQKVIKKVCCQLRETSFDVLENLVGIDSFVEELLDLLDLESMCVKIVGIWGMGGIGKTTLAQAVFDRILHKFEGHVFLEDIREASKQPKRLVGLQKQLLFAVLKSTIQSINNVKEGKSIIKKRLHAKRVLVVLDNVEYIEQLEALAGRPDWFGPGSRIIITARDMHVLNKKVDKIYEAKELGFGYSLQLFSKHAFGTGKPPRDFLELAEEVVHIAGGLPLVLEVLGRLLCDLKSPTVWRSQLRRLEKTPNKDIQGKLQISYDGLDKEDQQIFLDIACFFIGTDKEYVTYVGEGCGFSAEVGIQNLIHRSLVKIGDCNELRMHDQLRDMGRNIVREESANEPGKRSRLWIQEEVMGVLKRREGTTNIEGLVLEFEEKGERNVMGIVLDSVEEETALEENHFSSEDFEAMSKLRLLQIDNVHLKGDFKKLPSQLRWLSWKGCPSESKLTDFRLEKLVVLDLSNSRIKQVWNNLDQTKRFRELKVLNLSGCRHLTKTPDFSRLPNLEKLNLEGCMNLKKLESSICKLNSLKIINLSGCSNLSKLPDLQEYMEDLKVLDLSWCQCLTKAPNFSGLPNLETLNLEGCIKLEKLHSSICKLKSLKNFNLSGCSNLNKLPGLRESLKELKVLNLSSCKSLTKTPNFSRLPNLETLNLEGCIELRKLPCSICNLRSLKKLILSGCSNLNELPNLGGSLEELELLKLDYCKLLCRSPDLIGNMRNLKILSLDGTNITELPDAVGFLEKIEELSVSHCKKLVKLPDSMGTMRLLKKFSVDETGIIKLPEDFGMVSGLENLSMSNCREFRGFPDNFGSLVQLKKLNAKGNSKLAMLPISFSGLCSLEVLYASRCNFSEGGIPSDFGKLSSLWELDLSYNNFCSLPASISALSRLKRLDLANCRDLQSLPEMASSLKQLDVRNCISLESLLDMSNVKNVDYIYLSNCKKLAGIKGMEEMEYVSSLVTDGCSKGLLKSVNNGLSQRPFKPPFGGYPGYWTFSGSEIPDWFTPMKISYAPGLDRFGAVGYIIKVDCEEVGSRLWSPKQHPETMGVLFCFVFTSAHEVQEQSSFWLYGFYNRNGKLVDTGEQNQIIYSGSHQDQICLLHTPFMSNLEEDEGISFVITTTEEMEVKKGGVHVYYKDTKDATCLRMGDFITRLTNDDVDGGEPPPSSREPNVEQGDRISYVITFWEEMESKDGGYVCYQDTKEETYLRMGDFITPLSHDDVVDGGESSSRNRTKFQLLDLHDDELHEGEPSSSKKRFQVLDHDDDDDDGDRVISKKRTKFQLLDQTDDDDDDDTEDDDDDNGSDYDEDWEDDDDGNYDEDEEDDDVNGNYDENEEDDDNGNYNKNEEDDDNGNYDEDEKDDDDDNGNYSEERSGLKENVN